MIINQEKCVGCGMCVPYCPGNAISVNNRKATIDSELCFECSCCLRSKVCKVGAIEQDKLSWPRGIRSIMSDVFTIFEDTGVSGRGTEEMKTNDVTHRFKLGQVGMAIEVGRPTAGCTFAEVQQIAMELAEKAHVEFEPCNPITAMMKDNTTGEFREDILQEKVYSAILEFPVDVENIETVLEACKEISGKIKTLFSLDIATVTEDGQDARVRDIIDECGVAYSPNGKVNLGLGRPYPVNS